VFDRCERWRLPVAVSMAGGYGRDIAVTVLLHRQTLAAAQMLAQVRRQPV
jgi:hypothetical protein